MIKCRVCNSKNLSSIIPLGEMPLANALFSDLSDSENEKKYNLQVLLCDTCGLAQLKDLVSPVDLFSNYVYFSSNSDTMLKSAENLVEKTSKRLTSKSLIVEIASNDGYLLKNYLKKNIPVLGIDPAENIAKVANERGVNTLCEFFGLELAKSLSKEGKKADIVHANNVMAHIPDIHGFVEGLKIILKTDGQAIIEVPYFSDLIENLEFDTIYHEHVYYFSVKPLVKLFLMHDLEMFDIEHIPIHGGSLRLFVSHRKQNQLNKVVLDYCKREEERGLYSLGTYKNFIQRVDNLKKTLKTQLLELKQNGKKICVYGASAKGTTLLNYFEIGKELVDFIVDRSPAKQRKFSPGTFLEILPPEKMISEKIDYALLLAWNFADEIINQQEEFRKRGGQFIIPLPKVKVV